jgi:cation diffusion facilitator family transporter
VEQLHRDQDQRARQVRRVVLLILVLNLAVALAKALYGWASGSLAVTSDAIHSITDAASNVVGLLVLRLAAHPPDEGHPYGHQKIEILAASAIGLIISLTALRFGYTAVMHLLHGTASPMAGNAGFALLAGTLGVNLFVAAYEARRGRALQSAFLTADAAHTMSDVWVTGFVIASLVATRLGVRWADPVGALVVVAVILRVGGAILATNLNVLLDRAAIDEAEVRQRVMAVPGVISCHRIRSRGVEGAIHVDLHVLVDGDVPVREGHQIAESVEADLKAGLPGVIDVTVHLEPEGSPEENL